MCIENKNTRCCVAASFAFFSIVYENKQQNMNNEESVSNENFNSLKDYPESLLSYIDKYVKVDLIKNTSFSGFLHSIDPITFSVIISMPHEGNFKTTVIPGHAIIGIQEDTPSMDLAPPTRKCSVETSGINVIKRKVQLTAWFTKNLLPVKEDGDSLVIGNVSVLPPYSVTDICADNPVVALQIKKIMEAMPMEGLIDSKKSGDDLLLTIS